MSVIPDISIVIPCYNVAATLPATIASVVGQIHANWEAVCVDDESHDESRDLLAAYSREDPRIRWIFARHGGLAKTRNCGVKEARAPHVLFLDADDVLRPDALATLLKASATNPAAIIAGGYELLDSDATPLAIFRFPNVPEFSVDQLLLGNKFSVTTLVPRALLGDRPFDEEMVTACEDWNLWLSLAHRGVSCLTVPRAIFGYRLRAASLGHTSDLAYASGRQALERWLPHARNPKAARDALHRWAAICGARAFVSGSPDAISRYFEDLPPLRPTGDFPGAVASAILAAHEFVHGAAGAPGVARNASWPDEILAWLEASPLSSYVNEILAHLQVERADSRDHFDTARAFLSNHRDAQRLLIYGLGTNGSALLERIRSGAEFESGELCIADDHAADLTFEIHDLPRENPRKWRKWPVGTVALITPNDATAMRETLRRAGGREGIDFITLAAARANLPSSKGIGRARLLPSHSNARVKLRLSQVESGSKVSRNSARQEPRHPASNCARPSASRPDVSIIVACYNAAETVGETIASVQAQTYANWELICIDDESSDRTPEVLASLSDGDDRICWERVPHQGQPATKNRGVPLACADQVLFLDSDDVLRPDGLATLLQVSQRVGDDAIIAGGYELLDSAGRPLSIYRFPTVHEFSVDEFLRSNRISVVSLAPRRLLDEAPFDESLETCIDWDLWLRLANSGARCVTVPRVIFGYRLHPASLSRRIDTVYESGRAVLERWLPQTRDAAASRDVLHRWAAAQGALAFASGDPDAIRRYFNGLPAPDPVNDFPLAVASALSHALQFVHGAAGDGRRATAFGELAEVEAWLRSGPLAAWSDAILNDFNRISAVAGCDLAAVRDFLSANQQARRLVIYGLGANGVTMLERLRGDPAAGSIELVGADDHAQSLMFEILGLQRDNPRLWREWPESTIAIVTSNDFATMGATLRAAGGREYDNFLVLATSAASVARASEAAGVGV